MNTLAFLIVGGLVVGAIWLLGFVTGDSAGINDGPAIFSGGILVVWLILVVLLSLVEVAEFTKNAREPTTTQAVDSV